MADMTYQEALEFVAQVYGAPVDNIESVLRLYNADVRSADDVLAWFNETKSMSGAEIKHIKSHTGTSLGTRAVTSATMETNPINSNVALKKATEIPIASKVEVVAGNAKATFKTGIRETGSFVFGDVIPAIGAASVGVTLGKTLDRTLYNLNPNFFDSLGLWSLNPDSWNSLCTNDSDDLDKLLLPLLFGIDGRTGDTQAYMDEDAMVYLAKWLSDNGFFSLGGLEPSIESLEVGQTLTNGDLVLMSGNTYKATVPNMGTSLPDERFNRGGLVGSSNTARISAPSLILPGSYSATSGEITITSTGPYTVTGKVNNAENKWNISPPITITPSSQYALYIKADGTIAGSSYGARNSYGSVAVAYDTNTSAVVPIVGLQITQTLDGVGDQDGAVLPNTNDWTDLENTKQSLQTQYPDLWNNAKHYDYVDENGNNKTKTYIPVNTPKANNKKDNQPTSGDEKQSKPQVDTETEPTIQDLITTIITLIPSLNPDPTGSGDTPPTVIPVGSASSLWKIYNPTQAQVDAFGSWLWDSSFVEQIKKLFNDPMQAIIGIHKVFATPSTGGTANIKVGYLDSQISSAWVDNQYTTVNCGSASLNEYFGNVFDYAPYTKVQLYLPFIGIVDLDVGDVMRSTISVVYHVDVLTGACLADVKVNRDGAGGVLYQFAGSAIVTYPVSAGNYMGMLAGVLSVAGGVAGTILSGGALAPALIGGAVGASHLHTDVSHSGGFSGCAGAMGSKKPYLIVSRPQIAMADNYQHYTGIPANSKVTLGSCSGYAKVKSVYVNSITKATEDEKNMIEAQLKAGVLV